MCLYNTPSNIAIIMGLILNILKNHPKSLLLLIRKYFYSDSEIQLLYYIKNILFKIKS